MNNIAIIDNYFYYDTLKIDFNNVENLSLGGSETWTITSAKIFTKYNFNVYIICNCSHEYSFNNITWININNIEQISYNYKFDFVIITRNINKRILDLLYKNHTTNNIYIQVHDMYLFDTESSNNIYDINILKNISNYFDYNIVKGIICISNMQSESVYLHNNIPKNKIYIIPNIIYNIERFYNAKSDKQIDNSILWSSAAERGFMILADYIMPIVLDSIPNFMVYYCSNNELFIKKYDNIHNIKNLGRISKNELYNEMYKHGVWFYTSTFVESFNITCLENILCCNDFVLPIKDGMLDILKPYKNISLSKEFDISNTNFYLPLIYNINKYPSVNIYPYYNQESLDYMFSKKYNQQLIEESANMIVDRIKNYYDPVRIQLRESIKNYAIENFSEQVFINKWLSIFNIY